MEPSTSNITEYLHQQGEVFREKFPYLLLSGSLYTGTVYTNMIRLVNKYFIVNMFHENDTPFL